MGMTQKDMVLAHLEAYGKLTTFEAFTEYGITRLPSRICELRQEGYRIEGNYRTRPNRFGKKVSFCEYELAGK